MNNLVSVIMPNYNGAKFIRSAVESVIYQTFPYWELIIVDDCSTDESICIIEGFLKLDNRITLIKNDINSGVAFSRNRGIKSAKGKFISFLDSDDLWLPNKLEKQLDFIFKNGAKIVYSAYDVIDENNKILGYVLPPDKLDYNKLLKSNFIGNLTGLFDSESLGKPDVVEMGHEDFIFWLELLKKNDFAFGIIDVLARYRKKDKSLSSNKFKALKWQWDIYRKNQKINFFKSLFLIGNYAYYGLTKVKKK